MRGLRNFVLLSSGFSAAFIGALSWARSSRDQAALDAETRARLVA